MARELKRMLIAIEDGKSDEQVVDTGLDLAVDEGAEVIFVHVVSIPGESFVPTGEVARVPERATNDVLVGACEKASCTGAPGDLRTADRVSRSAARARRRRSRRRPDCRGLGTPQRAQG